jgi:membrane protein CcdC involved in cytochrome C biogenesis
MNALIRQIHRWLSIVFTAGVVGYMIVMTKGQPPAWVGLFALVPLILLLATGLYMFVLPYVAKGRSKRRASA